MSKYKELLKASEKINERNDCAVKALTVVLGIPYELSHKLFLSLGRRSRSGVTFSTIKDALKIAGAELEVVKIPAFVKTSKNLQESGLLENGRYLICTSGHIAGSVGGEIVDYTADRKTRVKTVYSVKLDNNKINELYKTFNMTQDNKNKIKERVAEAKKDIGRDLSFMPFRSETAKTGKIKAVYYDGRNGNVFYAIIDATGKQFYKKIDSNDLSFIEAAEETKQPAMKELELKTKKELLDLAKRLEITGRHDLPKTDLITAIIKKYGE